MNQDENQLISKAKAHAIMGKMSYVSEIDAWSLPLLCELPDGSMRTLDIVFGDKESIASVEEFFKRPSLDPMEIYI